MFTESSVVTYENIIIDFQKGTPASVEFDFMKIWTFRKLLKDQFNPDKLEFYHVHPLGFGTQMSSVDENCINGLSLAFNYPIKFSIVVFPESVCWKYIQERYQWDVKRNQLYSIEKPFMLGNVIPCLLKNLSNE